MKMKHVRKLILSASTIALTAASLTVSTFAWLNMNYVSEISEIKLTATNVAGLQMSLDGINFSQDITAKQINDKYHLDEMKYIPVTNQTNGFKKDKYTKINPDTATDEEKALEAVYRHGYEDAVPNEDYLALKVYFKIQKDSPYTNNKNYNTLWFTETKDDNGKEIGITGSETEVELVNSLVSNGVTYNAGDKLKVNPADAMRISIGDKVYEQSLGLGSTAIEGSTVSYYDKNNNAMYTYYNNLYNGKPFTTAASPYTTRPTINNYSVKQGSPVVKTTDTKFVKGKLYLSETSINNHLNAMIFPDGSHYYYYIPDSKTAGTDITREIYELNAYKSTDFKAVPNKTYYAKNYVKTEDTTVDQNKTYYTYENNTYTVADMTSVTDITANDYYEHNGYTFNSYCGYNNKELYEVYSGDLGNVYTRNAISSFNYSTGSGEYTSAPTTMLTNSSLKVLYEYGDVYFKTNDTSIDSSKTYYVLKEVKDETTGEVTSTSYEVADLTQNPSVDTLYELKQDYFLTTDKVINPSKKYYVFKVEYDVLKLTINIYLEGWDADYFAGIRANKAYDPSQFAVNLAFTVKEN